MKITCECGAIELNVTGLPIVKLCCHCDDCQNVHGGAYESAVYPSDAVEVVRGEVETETLKTMPRAKCGRCGSLCSQKSRASAFGGAMGLSFRVASFVAISRSVSVRSQSNPRRIAAFQESPNSVWRFRRADAVVKASPNERFEPTPCVRYQVT
jgi:hypothetical protein